MDYIELDIDRFRHHIVGENITIDAYIEHKRKTGIWGDDIEITALSEIYNATILIYAYSDKPLRTFLANRPNTIRLSYHQRSHFGSIIPVRHFQPIASHDVGKLEDAALQIQRFALGYDDIENFKEDESSENPSGNRTLLHSIFNGDSSLIEQYRSIVEQSRRDYQENGSREMALALEESLRAHSSNNTEEESEAIIRSQQDFDNQLNEDDLLNIAIAESINNNPGNIPSPAQYQNTAFDMQRESVRSHPIVQNAVAMGFLEDDAIQALLEFGNDQEMVMNCLLGNFN